MPTLLLIMQANTFTFFTLYWSIFTMLCWFQMYIKVSQLYIYSFFFTFFSHIGYYNRSLLSIYFIYSSVYMFHYASQHFSKMKPMWISFLWLANEKARLKYHSVHVYQFSNKPKQSFFSNYVPPWYVKILESESSINQINHPKPNIKKKKNHHTKVSVPAGTQVC